MRFDNANQRLKNLRQLHGMTQREFASELGIGQAQLSQIERGDRALTSTNMATAKLRFGVPLDFFDAEPVTYASSDLNYRTRKLTARERDLANVTFGLTEQAVRDLANTTNTIEPPRLESIDGMRPRREIEAVAADARRMIGIRPQKVINNVIRCLERLGILVTGLPLPTLSHHIDGISTPKRSDLPFVVTLDLEKPGDRLRFSAAHELGHILMHTDRRPRSVVVREDEADAFASAFLLPRERILDELSPGLTLAGYSRIKAQWGVSIQAIIRRSYDLGVIDQSRYRSLHIQLSSRGWRTQEPVEVPAEKPTIPTPNLKKLSPAAAAEQGGRAASGLVIDLFR